MQLTDGQRQVFQQLGMNPEFLAWLKARQSEQIKVLKSHPVDVQLHRAQGAAGILDEIEAAVQRK